MHNKLTYLYKLLYILLFIIISSSSSSSSSTTEDFDKSSSFTFYSSKNPEKMYHDFHKNMKQHKWFQNW